MSTVGSTSTALTDLHYMEAALAEARSAAEAGEVPIGAVVVALGILAEAFPDREVIGIHAVDLVWGLGTLHCMTQQQPAASQVIAR